jgi:phosphohistidine phosphatase SixA
LILYCLLTLALEEPNCDTRFMSNEIFLVRHGRYGTGGFLTQEGVEDAERALNELIDNGANEDSLILSSNARRAIETSKIIAQGIGAPIVESLRICKAGLDPNAVEDFDEWIEKSLNEIDCAPPTSSLIIVAHEPLLRVVLSHTIYAPSVSNGAVVSYEPGSWRNDDYEFAVERLIERQIAEENASN